MAIPGNWLVGDPGHVDEHNRIYDDLASKVELNNALADLQYAAPLYFGDLPPEDEGVIWVDTSNSWYPFPEGQAEGDVLTVMNPAERLSVRWTPGHTFAQNNKLTVPLLSGIPSLGNVTSVLTEGVASLEFPDSAADNQSYALHPFTLPENWTTYSFHVLWTHTGTQFNQTVMWRISRKELTVNSAIPTTVVDASGPSNENTPEPNVVASTQVGGTYTRTGNPLSLTITRLSTEDAHTGSANLLALELRKES